MIRKETREVLLTAVGVGAAVGLVAALSRAPGVLFADAGEFLTAIATKGIAHPPGFPLYLVLGGFFMRLAAPLVADPASRLNLFSALSDGAAAGAATAAAAFLLGRAGVQVSARARLCLAAAAGLVFGFGPTLFDFSLGIEVYALHAVFLAGALAAAIAGGGSPSPARERLTVLAGLCAGAGLAVHHATMIFGVLPGLPFLLWSDDDREGRWKRVALFSFAMLPGLATYAALPLRAATSPVFNWGDVVTARRLFEHVSAKIYQVNLESSSSSIWSHFGRFWEAYREELSLLGIAFAATGAALFLKRARHLVLGLLVAIAGDVAFAVRYEIAEDQAAYYIPTFLATSLLAALGAAALVEIAGRRRRGAGMAVLALAVLGGAGLAAANARARASRAHDARAPEATANVLASLPPRSILFTPEWNLYAPLLAAQEVTRLRTDLLVIDVLLLRRGWYLDTFARRNPDRLAEVRAEFDAFRSGLADWEEGRPYDGADLTRKYDAFTRKLTTQAWKRGASAFWVGTVMSEHLPPGSALVPTGLAYRILPSREEAAAYVADAPVDLSSALRPDQPRDEVFEQKIRPLYTGMLTQRALYELAFSRRNEASRLVADARRLAPDSPEAAEVAGDLALAGGDAAGALELYAESLKNGGDAARIGEKSRRALERGKR